MSLYLNGKELGNFVVGEVVTGGSVFKIEATVPTSASYTAPATIAITNINRSAEEMLDAVAKDSLIVFKLVGNSSFEGITLHHVKTTITDDSALGTITSLFFRNVYNGVVCALQITFSGTNNNIAMNVLTLSSHD